MKLISLQAKLVYIEKESQKLACSKFYLQHRLLIESV